MDHNKKTRKKVWLCLGFLLMAIAVILIVCFLLRGKIAVDGEWSGAKTAKTLACSSTDKLYPFFSYDKSRSKNIKINIIFDDNDIIKTGSLIYVLYYGNEKQINDSENLNRVSINENFTRDGLGFDALGVKFSRFSDGLQFSLYVNGTFDGIIAKYFMLDDLNKSITEIEQDYIANGFECKINNKESR